MKQTVKKLPYTIDAVNYSFDITTQQPQLFVTPDFNHLNSVLNEFADKMALRTGGSIAVHRAESSGTTATVVLDSGLQISGTFKDCIYDDGQIVYLKTSGPSSLCVEDCELSRHGKKFHATGYGSPVGKPNIGGISLQLMSEDELESAGFIPGVHQEIGFECGLTVSGILDYIKRHKGKNILFGFVNCTVTFRGEVLFRPTWGKYDMALGEKVISAYPGPADPEAFGFEFQAPAERTHKIVYDAKALNRHNFYQQMRDVRDGKTNLNDPEDFFNRILTEFPLDWLLLIELNDYLNSRNDDSALRTRIVNQLELIKAGDASLSGLIDDGLNLVPN